LTNGLWLIAVGTNHKYSPVSFREKLSLSKKRLKFALNFLRERGILRGAVILSTCNRVEIYTTAESPTEGIREIENFISRYYEIDKLKFSSYFYEYKGKEALRHLFSVACGLDSLILGETQILGQVKFSLSEAENAHFLNEFLRKIFYAAISFARRMHRETRISEGKISIGSVAIDFIKERIGTLQGKNILLIGVGKVTELVLRYLKKEKPCVIFISNRTFKKARELAKQIKAEAVKFNKLKHFLKEADVVISATASPHFIIKKEALEEAISYQQSAISNKLLIIDLALPRDVDPRVREIRDIDLFCLEDLDTVIKANMERKIQEAKKIKGIIEIEADKLWNGVTRLEREPALWL
jgi:glutamyl-tRNA reductase